MKNELITFGIRIRILHHQHHQPVKANTHLMLSYCCHLQQSKYLLIKWYSYAAQSTIYHFCADTMLKYKSLKSFRCWLEWMLISNYKRRVKLNSQSWERRWIENVWPCLLLQALLFLNVPLQKETRLLSPVNKPYIFQLLSAIKKYWKPEIL